MTPSKGKLVKWLEDKGFGFIKPEDGTNEIFIHISALKGMSRKPIVGDVIHYQISIDESGKTRAVSASIEGVSQMLTVAPRERTRVTTPNYARKENPYRKSSYVSKRNKQFSLFPIMAIIVIALFVYTKIFKAKDPSNLSTHPAVIVEQFAQPEKFQCQGKVWCSQMGSYEEALFYLRNCPGTKMDGDGDGEPCERQFSNGSEVDFYIP
jgi:cold shock CspA family protein